MDAIAPDPAAARAEMQRVPRVCAAPRVRRGNCSRTPICSNLDTFLADRADARCRATRCARAASSIPGAWSTRASPTRGRWAACATPGMRLEPIWNARETAQVQGEIWKGSVRSAGRPARRIRASSATRWRFVGAGRRVATGDRAAPAPTRDSRDERRLLRRRVTRSRLDRAVDASRRHRRVGGDRRQAGSAEHRRRHRAHPVLRQRDRRRRRAFDGWHRRRRRRERRHACWPTAAAARARRSGARSRTSSTPVTVFLDADGSHDPEDIPLLVEPILRGRRGSRRGVAAARRIERAARRVRRVPAARRQLVHHRLHQLAVQLSAERQPERLPRACGPAVLRQLDLRENTTTIEQEMTIKTLRRGWRMAEVPSHEHRANCTARRTSASGATRRATATRSSSTCSSDAALARLSTR